MESRRFSQGARRKAGCSFELGLAIWRWWLYRETVLYKRLEEFVRESDRRLAPASNEVVRALLRPSDTIPLTQPAYAVELRRVLDTHGWRSWIWFGSLEKQADRQIGKLMSGIRKRERILEKAHASLTNKSSSALTRGSRLLARARRATVSRNRRHAKIIEHSANSRKCCDLRAMIAT